MEGVISPLVAPPSEAGSDLLISPALWQAVAGLLRAGPPGQTSEIIKQTYMYFKICKAFYVLSVILYKRDNGPPKIFSSVVVILHYIFLCAILLMNKHVIHHHDQEF